MSYLKESGKFGATVAGTQLGESSNGKPYIQIEFTTDSGSIYWKGFLTEAALERTSQTLVKAFKWNGDVDAIASGRNPFEGQSAQIVVEEREYDGKTFFEVKYINAPRNASSNSEVVKEWSKEFKQRIKQAVKDANAETIPAKKTVKAEDPLDDEIPF